MLALKSGECFTLCREGLSCWNIIEPLSSSEGKLYSDYKDVLHICVLPPLWLQTGEDSYMGVTVRCLQTVSQIKYCTSKHIQFMINLKANQNCAAFFLLFKTNPMFSEYVYAGANKLEIPKIAHWASIRFECSAFSLKNLKNVPFLHPLIQNNIDRKQKSLL